MDWSQCPDVESTPNRMSGEWVVKSTRVPADAIVENAAEGYTPEQIATDLYPTVPLDAVRRILKFAKPRAVHSA